MKKKILLFVGSLTLFLSGCTTASESVNDENASLEALTSSTSECSAVDYAAGKALITGQLTAFEERDTKAAYSYASDEFKSRNSLAAFTSIIESQYSMLLDLRSFEIRRCVVDTGLYYFEVKLVDNAGAKYSMEYALSRISGQWGVVGAAVSQELNQ